MEVKGLTEFQKEILSIAQDKLPRESYKIMRKIGSKARTFTARRARGEIRRVTGNYHRKYGFKRGKVFKGHNGEYVVRVYNAAPHAHLIEHGHRMVTKDGREVGFVRGKNTLEKSAQAFEQSGQMEKMLGDWLDDLLESGKL